MIWFRRKNLYFSLFIILLIVSLGGLCLSPLFSIPNHNYVLAGSIQSSVIITICGNGIVETGEVCDTSNLDGQTCVSQGYDAGTLYCASDCYSFNVSGCTTTPPPSGGGGGGSVYIPPATTETKVVLQGRAYPNSSVTVLKDGSVAGTVIADPQANFKVEITDITAGTYTFGIWAEDKDGRKSITFSFTTSVSSETITTIGGIFLPPTIELDKIGLKKGEILNILGQTAPESKISIFINSADQIVKETKAEKDGTWFYAFNTTPLEDGSHTSRAKSISPDDLTSTYSKTLSFYIGEGAVIAKQSDISGDGKINLVDFSILLYNWGTPKNPSADLNNDGKVSIVDFSILLYYWTG